VTSESGYSNLRGWWAASVLALAGFVSYTDRLIMSAFVDPVRQSFSISDAQFGFVQGTAFSICCVFSGLVLGRLVDTSHRVRIVFSGALLWCAGTVFAAEAQRFWGLALARAFVGIGEGALAPGAVSIIADMFAVERRGAPLGLFFMGLTVGAPASIAVGSLMLGFATAGGFRAVPLLSTMAPWRAALAAVGMAGFLVPVLILTLREPKRKLQLETRSVQVAMRALFEQRHLLAPAYLAMGLLAVGDFATLSWVPTLLTRKFAMSLAHLAVAFGVITGMAGAAACLCGGVISDIAARTGGSAGRLFLSLAFVALAACGALLISGSSPNLVLVGIGVWTFGAQTAAFGGIAFVQAVAASSVRGVAIALVAFCNLLLGLGLGPPLIALVTEHVYHDPRSIGPAITTIAVPAALLAGMLFLISTRATSRSINHRSPIHG
jgi:predicted MFS family arabinose efflux permease